MQTREYRILKNRSSVRHAVTLRDPAEPLNASLALHTGEDPEAIGSNRARLREFFGQAAHFVSVLQVHGDRVYRVESARSHGWTRLDEGIRADALMTNIPEVVLTILTADCVPILLYDPVARAVAAVHAGWQGSRLGIAAKTVEAMREAYGCNPEDLLALIGPSIGGCCYEVGPEVAEHFSGNDEALRPAEEGKFFLDLKAVNRRQLSQSGLRHDRIETAPECTACEKERFFSYRAEGGCSGRFLSGIMLTKQ